MIDGNSRMFADWNGSRFLDSSEAQANPRSFTGRRKAVLDFWDVAGDRVARLHKASRIDLLGTALSSYPIIDHDVRRWDATKIPEMWR
jgi:hypothetical protein